MQEETSTAETFNIKIINSKKLSNLFIFTNEKNSNIDDWLSVMKNKLKENENWFSNEIQKKTYVRTRLKENVMKHLSFRFKKKSIKSFAFVEKIFDDFNRIFENFNKWITALKVYRRFKQMKVYKEFHIFWAEFQRVWRICTPKKF